MRYGKSQYFETAQERHKAQFAEEIEALIAKPFKSVKEVGKGRVFSAVSSFKQAA